MLGGLTALPCSWGNKYGNLASGLGESQSWDGKILSWPRGTRTRERLRWRGPTANVNRRQIRPFIREGAPRQLVRGLRWMPDTKAERSSVLYGYNFDFDLADVHGCIWGRCAGDSEPRKTALARASSKCKLKTHPLIRERIATNVCHTAWRQILVHSWVPQIRHAMW
jgi:hypothetical protein